MRGNETSVSVVKCSWVKCGECSLVMVLVIRCLTLLEDV